MTAPTCHPDKPLQARGLCAACYMRLRRTGSVERADAPTLPMLRDPDAPCCDVCAADGIKLVRFNLVVKAVKADGRPTSRGAGVITLCGRCWASARRKVTPGHGRKAPLLRVVAA